jgi:hypothetical protein
MNVTFNTNIQQWATLQNALALKKIEFWDVSDQWDRTEYKDKYAPAKPFAMILLKACKKIVILVWGNARYYAIEDKHTINKIITGIDEILPRACATREVVHKP